MNEKASTGDGSSLAETVAFELLGRELGRDVRSALKAALAGGAVFHSATDPLSIFRQALRAAIRDIQSRPRGELFQAFLTKGPYERDGKVTARLRGQRLSDADTAAAITFIHAHMVNCFKGAITEMLACEPCLTILKNLQGKGSLPRSARLYVGDAVAVKRLDRGYAKGADLHILIADQRPTRRSSVVVAGVAEVKSYFRSDHRLMEQLAGHLRRAGNGLRVCGMEHARDLVQVGWGTARQAVQILVQPSDWKLLRTFRFRPTKNGRALHVDPGTPPTQENQITRVADDQWRVSLRWSKEALTAAAHEMTFWYMAKVGEAIYARGVPKEWSEMTPAQAGRNVAKMMLYYAILRCRTARESQRAIALYNSYGFGYALGTSFRDARGRREMLWAEDLDEILRLGRTESGCRVVG